MEIALLFLFLFQQAEPSYNTILVISCLSTAQMTDHNVRKLQSDHKHNVWFVHGVVSFPSLCYWSKCVIIA
jgi:hypothetical protein